MCKANRLNFYHIAVKCALPLLVTLPLMACGGAASPTAPTLKTQSKRASASPTVINTAVQANGTATIALPPEIAAAFTKTLALSKVRYEITSEITYTKAGALVHQTGVSAKGEENGENQHLAISGIMNRSGQPGTYEFIKLEGVTYAKGLGGIPGVDPTQWYRFPKELGNVTRDAPSIKSLLTDLKFEDFHHANFASSGSESLDGQPCKIWSAQNAKLAQGFLGIANSSEASSQLQALDNAEFQVWVCADGYLHRITGLAQGHNPNAINNKASVQLTLRIFAQNADVKITPPSNAQDFQLPVQGAVTPTP